ncbi:nicotinate phosphoribosyltransferase [Paenibacillus thiaminolyticus]|uniref:nicotinate phosphoribosyltransferase n=1 Tax=Paenibacillus thiaminolyticus TaxID=49283 RepID=UPI001164F572|nr:nicotinate phosphoribosyltransferase [Paenibacillus thiaminolyticus]NGP62656.1 nicotinate phosphoribosyltransferase [Paenibacillus thiaminolyticus]
MNASMALHTDKYQINMMYAHWKHGTHNQKTVFEAFFRKLPFHNGYAVFAGLERIIEYMEQLRFTEEDIAYLREQEEEYEEAFLQELSNFRFTGHIDAAREGTLVFANEPLIRVEGRIFETQLIETALLNFMNFQTLIATKASRIKYVAGNDILMEFGTRRAQEADAALWGARAAYLAGFHATSNMLAGRRFGIPTKGTHAHAWVQSFENEQEAFQAFAEALPNQVTLLVDTYDTLHSGIPNAIEIGKELAKRGKKLQAIRLDSGDLAYLSIEARRMLDEAGLNEVQIVASNDLDEYTISDLKLQGARIDMWGVGTQLITAADQPSLGGVYKLVSREVDGVMQPTIKISANPEKVTTPGKKDVYRIIHKKKKKAIADYICLTEEDDIERRAKIKLFDPIHPYLHKYVEHYDAEKLLHPIYRDGKLVYERPPLDEIRQYHCEQLQLFWPEYLRKTNPERYHVDISTKAWQLKHDMIESYVQEQEQRTRILRENGDDGANGH